ncbi:MAG: radical SAM protein [Desulfobulbaceae bacterium]|nr:radical SAM protein [Desulfobulbaceae bacterium]
MRNPKPLVIPVFIPHEGCPHSCVFCNQHRISGVEGKPVTGSEVAEIIRTWLKRGRKKNASRVQAAFYGGSFTGLSMARQQELLFSVQPFIQSGEVQTIRLSTRPDYIDPGIVAFLQEHQVATVELGAQSLDDCVLKRSLRGHLSEDVLYASGLLKAAGMELGIQLMVGLPGQTFTSLRKTVARVVTLAPAFIRIYPVLVVAGSGLEPRYGRGEYQPLSLSRAVLQAAWMKKKMTAHGIRVVRMGLQPGPELEHSLVAGPYHPAFGELVNARLMLGQTRKLLSRVPPGRQVRLQISDRDQSVFRGIRSANIHRLTSLGLSDRFTLHTDPDQARGVVQLIPDR